MPNLSLALLGPLQATCNGKPISGLTSSKARAMLAYLAVESDRAHPREALAEFLWPDCPREAGLASLRNTLALLRRALGDQQTTIPFLLASRDTLRFNRGSDYWLDLHVFGELVAPDPSGQVPVDRLEQAIALYRGEFLTGVVVRDSPAFEEWLILQRDALSRQAHLVLQRLAAAYESKGDYSRAEFHLRRQLALEPWREETHRELMRLLSLSGHRTAALAQYEACKRALKTELDVEPARETSALYERIREGRQQSLPIIHRPHAIGCPPLAGGAHRPSLTTRYFRHFVARERELAWLDRRLQDAVDGQGRVAFVTGEAGSGKTALLLEFAGSIMRSHRDLVVVMGSCNAETGQGAPYLPFREALQMLTSDVEAKRSGNGLDPEQARRLWALLPQVLQALVECGPDLINLLIPGQALLARARTLGPDGEAAYLPPLERLLQRRPARQGAVLQQTDLFEQVTRLLLRLADGQTVLLILDDLQWADRGSISLLFHLGRRLAGSRILLLGAYRPDDVAMGRGGERHPLEPVVHELARDFGEVLLDLDLAEGRRLVDQLLDTEPNQLGEGFGERLYQHTAGHALFTVELLRRMAERGDLAKDESGCWVKGPHLDWEVLPARVEAVIAERIGRLPLEQQRLLEVAGVEGEEFTAEVISRAVGAEQERVARLLSGPLGREHRLVSAMRLERQESHRFSHFRFRHNLFQQYLYHRLDDVERGRLHESVGKAMEGLYGERAKDEKAMELARHFESAGMVAKAVEYLIHSGNYDLRLCAWQEARGQFERARSLLETLPESPERDRWEVDLQLALGSARLATDGFGSRGQIAAYARAHELSRKLGTGVQLWPALHALANSSTARGEYRPALDLGEELLRLAKESGESWLLALAHFTLGSTLFSSGISLIRAREHLEQAILFYEHEQDPERCRFLTSINAFDLGVNSRAWLATVLWILGYPDQALKRSKEALSSARQLDHFLSQVLALYAASHSYQHRGEDEALRESIEQLHHLIRGKPLLIAEVWVEVFSGWLLVRDGQVDEGLKRILEGTTEWQKAGAVFGTTAQLIVLTEACLLVGRVPEGLEAVDRGLALVERTEARSNEADLYWLRGELLLAQGGDVVEAEAWFHRAMGVARGQEARSYELRAATSLARLWRNQGRRQEARELLAAAYSWFTEGFDTPDLLDAKRLLAEL